MVRINDRPNRSDAYQQLYNEVMVDDKFLTSFSNSESMYSYLNPFQYSEELLELNDELRIEFLKLVDEKLKNERK